MTIMRSSKRSYQIRLSETVIKETISFLNNLSKDEVQDYIDSCFKKSSGHAKSGGAIKEKSIWRDKAKLAILFLESIKE